MTEHTTQSIGNACWHIERRQKDMLKRIEAIEAALLGLQDDPEGHAPNLGDDDWSPDKREEDYDYIPGKRWAA